MIARAFGSVSSSGGVVGPMVEEAFVRNGSVRLHVLHARLLLTAQTPLLITPGMADGPPFPTSEPPPPAPATH